MAFGESMERLRSKKARGTHSSCLESTRTLCVFASHGQRKGKDGNGNGGGQKGRKWGKTRNINRHFPKHE